MPLQATELKILVVNQGMRKGENTLNWSPIKSVGVPVAIIKIGTALLPTHGRAELRQTEVRFSMTLVYSQHHMVCF